MVWTMPHDGKGEWIGTARGKQPNWVNQVPGNREERRLAERQTKREQRTPTKQLKKKRRKR